MTHLILPLLVCVAGLLLVLAAVETPLAAHARRGIGLAAAGLAGWGGLLAMIWLALDHTPTRLHQPEAVGGIGLRLALDPLSAFTLVLVLLAGAAVIAFATLRTGPPRTRASSRPSTPGNAGPIAVLGASALTLLAANPLTLALGLSIIGLALWLTEAGTTRRTLACGWLVGTGVFAAAATLVLSPTGADQGAGLAPLATDPVQTTLVILLALAGPGALLGLLAGPPGPKSRPRSATPRSGLPAERWQTPLLAVASPAERAMIAGCVLPAAATVLLRLILAPHPPEASFWWGVPLLALGGIGAIRGAWHATTGADLPAILTSLTQRQAGLLVIGLGLALIARSADLPDMANLALGAVCLSMAGQALNGTLVFLAAWAASSAAGTPRLDRLGGLLHRMPLTGTAMLIGASGLIALPPGIGFAVLWDLVQALLIAPRIGPASAWIFTLLAGVLGLSAALGLAAVIRMVGVAFLGRPRQPRSSAAEDIPRPARPVLLILSALSLLTGIMPALVPALLAGPAIHAVTGTTPRADTVLLNLLAGGRHGYAPLLVFVLIAIGIVLALRLIRRPMTEIRTAPAWSGGFAPPPPWLPFGDPLTQTDGTGFVPTIDPPAGFAHRARAWPRRFSRRRVAALGPWLIVAALVPVLLMILARGAP